MILANRSAALYHLGRHQRALGDIEEAGRLGYPRELLYKLEERRARCLLGVKRHDEAIGAFRRALAALDDAKVTRERVQKLEMDIRTMLAVMDESKRLNQATARNAPPIGGKTDKVATRDTEDHIAASLISKEKSLLYPACSRAVEIRDDGGDVGRHAIATRRIAPGEVVIVERPHCAFLLAENRCAPEIN